MEKIELFICIIYLLIRRQKISKFRQLHKNESLFQKQSTKDQFSKNQQVSFLYDSFYVIRVHSAENKVIFGPQLRKLHYDALDSTESAKNPEFNLFCAWDSDLKGLRGGACHMIAML